MRMCKKLLSIILAITLIFNIGGVDISAAENSDLTNSDLQTSGATDVSNENKEGTIIAELVEKRDANIKHFLKDDNTYEAVEYPFPVHYLQDGEWKDIDNTLEDQKDEDNNDVLENVSNDFKIKIAKNTEANKLVRIDKDKYELSWSLDNVNKSQAVKVEKDSKELDGLSYNDKIKTLTKVTSKVDFANIYSDVDLQYELKGDLVKENVIINKPTENFQLSFKLDFKNLIPELQEDNSIIFYDDTDKDKAIFNMQVPYMYDANGAESNDIKVTLNEEKNEYILNIKPSEEWLNSNDRAYPITIDPPISSSLNRSDIKETFVSSLDSSDKSTNQYLRMGNTPVIGYSRSYIKFVNLPSLSAGDMVTNATLYLLREPGASGTMSQINIHKVTQDWQAYGLNWSNKPAYDSKILDYGVVSSGEWYTWDITSIAKDWYSNGTNYGLMLKYDNEDAGYSSFWSSDIDDAYASCRPCVIFYYVNNSGLESYWTYHSQDVGRAGTGYVNDYNGNLVHIHEDLSMTGNRMPATVEHVFNSNTKDTNLGYGAGWRLNYSQKVTYYKNIDGVDYYKYEDQDGTVHYFKYDSASGKYKDESGVDLTLTKNADGTFTITDTKNNLMNFTTSGYLSNLKDSNGDTLTLSYEGTKIKTITDGVGRVITLQYNVTSGNLEKITDPSSRITTFTYSGNSLTKITYPDLKYSSFVYDASMKLTSAVNIDGYKVNYSYYSNAPYRVSSVLETHTNGTLGEQLNFSYGRNMTSFTDSKGRKSIYQFNDHGNTVSVTDGEGSAKYYEYIDDSSSSNINKLSAESKLQKTTVNLLKNHNLETTSDWSGPYSWGSNTGTQSFTTEDKYMGYQSIKVTSTNNLGGRDYEQSLTLEKGVKYTLSAYVKTQDIPIIDSAGASFFIGYTDATGTSQFVKKYISGTKDWERYELNFTLPTDAQSNMVWIGLSMLNSTGTAYFDCVQLEKGSIANRYNLVENANFTYGGDMPTYWSGNGDIDANDKAVTTEAAPYPSNLSDRCFRIVGNSTKQKALAQFINEPGKQGDSFVLGGWLKGASIPTSVSKSFALSIGFQLNDNSYEWHGIDMSGESTDWQYVANKIVPNNDYKKIVIYLIYYKNANNAYFDGIQLYKEEFSTSFQYDSKGNVVSTGSLAKQNSSFAYDTNNNLITSTNPKGSQFKYEYDTKHNVTKATSAENVVYSFEYDTYGNPKTSKVGDSSLFMQSTSTYTANGNYMSTLTDNSGKTITYNYNQTKGTLDSVVDPKQKTTSYTYDANTDNLLSVSKIADGKEVKNSYTYDNDMLKTITHNGFNYNFAYDSLGNNTSVSVGSQNLITNSFETRTGKLLESTYGNGKKVSFDYDNQDRIIAKKYDGVTKYKYEYDACGNIGYHEDLVNGVNFRYIYDLSDRLVNVLSTKGDTTKYEYDLNNNVSQISQYFNGAYSKNLCTFSTPSSSDLAAGKPAVSSSNEVSTLSADKAFDSNGSTRWASLYSDPQWIYVDLGSVKYISRVVLDWESAYGKSYSIQVSNDAVNWSTVYSTTTGDGGTDDITGLSTKGRYVRMYGTQRGSSFGYSLWNFQVYEGKPIVSSSNETTSLTADKAFDNNSSTRWSSSFSDSQWIYVDLGSSKNINRVVLNWQTAYGKSYDIQVSNDATNWTTVYSTTTGDGGKDEISGIKATGRYVRMLGKLRGTTFGYSLWEFNVYEEDAKTVQYEYDKDNRQTKTVIGPNISAGFQYDTLGRLKTNTLNTGSIQYKTSYNYLNGPVAYSSTSKVQSIVNNDGSASASTISYTYDANGNIETVTEGTNITKYYYNELNELIREDNKTLNKTIVYSYDVGGNILSKIEYPYTTGTLGTATSTTNCSYGDTNWKDKLTAYNGDPITYDAIGNPLTYVGYTFSWEAGRRLSSISGNGKNISYKYDDEGIRTEKTYNGVTTKYHLVDNNVVLEENGTDKIYYSYDSENQLISMNLNGTEYFYIRNVQDDIIGLIDTNGNQVVTYTYDTWGKLISITGTLKDTVGVKNPYRYRGYRYDTETGYYYLQSRYYSPYWGRFINADALGGKAGELLSHNMFAYCLNNPVNQQDPSGNWAIPTIVKKFFAPVAEFFGNISTVVAGFKIAARNKELGIVGAVLGLVVMTMGTSHMSSGGLDAYNIYKKRPGNVGKNNFVKNTMQNTMGKKYGNITYKATDVVTSFTAWKAPVSLVPTLSSISKTTSVTLKGGLKYGWVENNITSIKGIHGIKNIFSSPYSNISKVEVGKDVKKVISLVTGFINIFRNN